MAKPLELRLSQFQKALATLREILKKKKTEIIRDATIQRFEYSFGALWRLLKIYLSEKEGVEAYSLKAVFREAGNIGIIPEKELLICLQMTDDRNLTARIYKEAIAEGIYKRIQKDYCRIMSKIEKKLLQK